MEYRPLGTTGLRVSAISFGAGPVSELMTDGDSGQQQAVVAQALRSGINWFDTAATYGEGRSETSLGAALQSLDAAQAVHVATKVRLFGEHLDDIREHVRRSVVQSLARLRLPRVSLVQIHNSITARRGDEATSLTPGDVLGPGGVLGALRELQSEGLVDHIGLTGLGQPEALRRVIESGAFATIQVPYNLLNPSAGQEVAGQPKDANYGNVMAACARQEMGVFAIRVFAGGALIGRPPSRHTQRTPFFPLPLYRRDQRQASRLRSVLNGRLSLTDAAVRFALGHPAVSSAIIGFAELGHVDEAIAAAAAGPLPAELLAELRHAANQALTSAELE